MVCHKKACLSNRQYNEAEVSSINLELTGTISTSWLNCTWDVVYWNTYSLKNYLISPINSQKSNPSLGNQNTSRKRKSQIRYDKKDYLDKIQFYFKNVLFFHSLCFWNWLSHSASNKTHLKSTEVLSVSYLMIFGEVTYLTTISTIFCLSYAALYLKAFITSRWRSNLGFIFKINFGCILNSTIKHNYHISGKNYSKFSQHSKTEQSGFKLTLREMQFEIHFDNFPQHFSDFHEIRESIFHSQT